MLCLFLLSPGLGWAYLTDKTFHAEPAPPTLAAAGSSANDPTFGTKIVRLTDSADDSLRCMTQYSNVPAFNVDNTKVAAYCGLRFKTWDFNPVTMVRSNPRIQANPPNNLREEFAQWSRLVANKFFACSRAVLYEITLPAGSSTTYTNTVVRDFRTLIGAQANDQTDFCTQISVSANDNIFGLHYYINGAIKGYIAYQRNTNTVLLHTLDATVNEVEIDKSGRYLVKCCNPSTVWDLQAGPTQTTITVEDFGHRGMGNGIVVSNCSASRLCKRNLATPNTVTPILTSGWSYATNRDDHFSLVNSDSWLLGCRFRTQGESASAAYDQECLAISTTGDEAVKRYLHHRSNVYSSQGADSYWAQPRGNISMDGKFMAFSSNWEAVNVNGRNDLYIADLQELQASMNPGPATTPGRVPGASITPAPRGFTLTYYVDLALAILALWRARWKILKATATAYRTAGEATFTYYWRWKVKRWLKQAPTMITGGDGYATLYIWNERHGCWDHCTGHDVAVCDGQHWRASAGSRRL